MLAQLDEHAGVLMINLPQVAALVLASFRLLTNRRRSRLQYRIRGPQPLLMVLARLAREDLLEAFLLVEIPLDSHQLV